MALVRSVSSWVRRRARASEAVLIGLAVVVGGVAGLLSVVQGAIARTLQHWLFALPNGGRLSAADHLAPLALLALPLGGLAIRVLETPGHSEGSVCLLVEGQGVLFAGDTLFRCSCGRCDFPGGDYRKMLASLGRLAALEGNLRVLPGHDMETTLDYERRVNPYMRQGSAR